MSKHISNKAYEATLKELHTDLVHLQEWVKKQGLKVVIIFEGRDASGKGGTIKRLFQRNIKLKPTLVLLFLIFVQLNLEGQSIISGIVLDDTEPLEGASVYLNNTTTGAITNTKGEFRLEVDDGQYELIISYLGYKTLSFPLDTETVRDNLVFYLEEQADQLDEIVIKKTVYDKVWEYNLLSFKEAFLGKSEIAKSCEILNPKTLHFEYNYDTKTFTAFARDKLQIKNEALGYQISYDLTHFEIIGNYLTYLGYAFYQPLKGSKRKQKQWQQNRLKAYNGSNLHFYRALLKNEIEEDGFIVNQFRRERNKQRPTDEEIAKASAFLRRSKISGINNLSKVIDTPKTAVDSAIAIVRKRNLPRFTDYLYKSGLNSSEIVTFQKDIPTLSFENNISVVYTKEKEELAYVRQGVFSKSRAPVAQTSSIIPLKKFPVLDKRGILINPLDVSLEGYWSFEKFGDFLPLDYEPDSLD
ncbi:MAG: carboxypeptidase-like regulatory domain-containing protein [Jejuia sp.]